MSDMGIWKCPNCETLNNENFCRVCGCARPADGAPNGFPGGEFVPPAGGNKNKGLLIALVSVVAVLLIVVIVFVGYFLFGRGQNDADDASSAPAVTETVPVEIADVYYVNKFDDSGIYVRSGPGKDFSKILYIKKGDQSVHLRYLNNKVKGDDDWFWYYVETPDGDVGYVREDVVIPLGEEE